MTDSLASGILVALSLAVAGGNFFIFTSFMRKLRGIEDSIHRQKPAAAHGTVKQPKP